LLDRAEAVFVKLRGTRFNDFALNNLLDIYQQEKDWKKAIEIAEALPHHEGVLWEKEVANFHCELAAAAMANSRFDEAMEAGRALELNRKSVRANMLMGDLCASRGDDRAALEAWKMVEKQNPIYLALVAERIMDAYRRLGELEQGIQLLRSYLDKYPSLDLLDALFQWELQKEGPQVAYQLVRDELRRNPTLLGLDKLLEAALLTAPAEQRTDIELVKSLVHGHTRRVARYRCDTCGFKARQFYWRCPACGGWETYPPKRTEEFDLAPEPPRPGPSLQVLSACRLAGAISRFTLGTKI
jgi:lipopolysaccharide biosynthesis regulator YciM